MFLRMSLKRAAITNYCYDISKVLTGLTVVENDDDEAYSTYTPYSISQLMYGADCDDEEDQHDNDSDYIDSMLYGTHVEHEYSFHWESYDVWKTLTEVPRNEETAVDEAIYQIYYNVLLKGL
jgi:hypothetical protein